MNSHYYHFNKVLSSPQFETVTKKEILMATLKSQKEEVQVSFRTSPQNKHLARIEAAKNNMSLNEWIKSLVESQLPQTSDQDSQKS